MRSFTGDRLIDMEIAQAGGYEFRRAGIRGSVVPADEGPDWPADRWLLAANVRLVALSRVLDECIRGSVHAPADHWRADFFMAINRTTATMQSLLEVIADQSRMAAAEQGIFMSETPPEPEANSRIMWRSP